MSKIVVSEIFSEFFRIKRKRSLRFFLAAGVMFFLAANCAKAQGPYDLVVGGEFVDQLIELKNEGATVSQPTITIKLANGVHIQGSGSINPSSGLSNGATLSFVEGNTNEFKLKLSGDFPNNSVMSIRFTRMATTAAVLGTTYKDIATISIGGGGQLTADSEYAIWEPFLNPESAAASPYPDIIAGQDVQLSAKIKNTGQYSYTSSFKINIAHENFETPKNIVLAIGGTELVVAADKISTTGSITAVSVTSEMLKQLGKADGRFAYYPGSARQDELLVKYTAAPKISKCNDVVEVKVSATCNGRENTSTGGIVTMNVLSPGFTLSAFSAERHRNSYDFPDALDNGSVNGTWGSANPVKNMVRNGDTLVVSMSGLIRTSSLIPTVQQLNATIGFSDGRHDELIWLAQVQVRVKKLGNVSWDDYAILADVQSSSGLVRYKVSTPEGASLQTGDEVELILTAIMRDDAATSGLCTLEADVFALETPDSGTRYPTAACKVTKTQPLSRVVIKNSFVAPLTITGSCAPVVSTAIFKSTAYSTSGTSCTNCFREEFRANHYVKELLVYVPKEGKLSSGTIDIAGTTFTYTTDSIPTPTTISFTDGVKTYPDAKCYTFQLEGKYGVYGSTPSLFKDEVEHELTANFDVVFENPVNAAAQTLSVIYVATPVNPSAPLSNLHPLSAIQRVTLPAISPLVTVTTPPGREVEISPVTGEVAWYLSVANTTAGAAPLDNLSLQLEDITGGAFSSLTVTQSGQTPKQVVANSVSLAPIPGGVIHTLEIRGAVSSACNNVEQLNAILVHNPCGGQGIQLAKELLAFKAPASTIQVSSTLSSTNLTMCEEFEVTMVVSAFRGTVKDPVAKLVLPKNSEGLIGVDFVGVRKDGSSTDYPYTGDLDVLTFDLNAIAGVSQLSAGESVTLKVRLKPNCNFPINSRLTSYAYGKNFCSTYNSEGSGNPIRTDYLAINGLQSSYTAQVSFSEVMLTFDKSSGHGRKSTKLTITKLTGGNIGAGDVISLSMPKALRVEIDGVVPTTAFVDEQRVVTWPVPAAVSTSSKEYNLTFIMDTPAAYDDVLNGAITAVVINKVQGLACGSLTCPSLETKAGEGTTAYRIVDLFPALAKNVSYTASSLMSFKFTYTFTLKNFGSLPLGNLRLQDSLADFYSKGTVSGISLSSSSPGLICSPTYNGSTDTQLLAAGSYLPANETQTVTLSFYIKFDEEWRDKTFTISNTAITIGSNENGTDYEDTSNSGTTPDLTDDTPTITDPIDTNPPVVVIDPVIDTPPPGFAITADGVECFEGNEGTTTPLEFKFKLKDGKPLDYDLCFTVFTRDSIAMVSDSDYIQVQPKVVCIPAGKVYSDESVVAAIVGDGKFERDEPFMLAVKPSTSPMTCNPISITILNDDAEPNVVIDDITLDNDNGVVLNLGDFSHLEGTSLTERTKFKYCAILNVAAPQNLVLRVVVGNDNDTAIPSKDYYVNGAIAIPIAAGEDRACFEIEVEPDNIPENNEVFTMSFSLEAGGVVFFEEVKKTVIVDDDEFTIPANMNDLLIYCEGDDATAQAEKLKKFITVDSRYELKWYSSPTSAVQIPEPVIATTLKGSEHTYWLGYYDPEEDYETPISKRSKIVIRIQDTPQLDITSSPASPMTLKPGQSVVLTATAGLSSYDFILNDKSLTPTAIGENEQRVHRDKLASGQNTVEVKVVDYAGCPWSQSITVDIAQTELPNTFIPEGSNPENQIFLKDYDLRVFNRWGHLLYQGTNGWDGRYKGAYVATGTYYYVVNVRQEDGTMVEEKGSVMVVGAAKK